MWLTSVMMGTFVALSTEILSSETALSAHAILGTWLLAFAAAVAALIVSTRHHRNRLGEIRRRLAAKIRITAKCPARMSIILLLVATGTIGILSAPNTWDSMTYHLTAHHALDGSGITGILPLQLSPAVVSSSVRGDVHSPSSASCRQ